MLNRLGFGRCFSPSLISHDARIIPSSTCKNHSPKTAPGTLKFYEMGSKFFQCECLGKCLKEYETGVAGAGR